MSRALVAEALGTALLVFVGAGVATVTLGFGLAGGSPATGIVATALAFGLVLLILVYAIGSVSGCHINPAVTMGFLVARRIGLAEAGGYWVAQFVGGIIGALGLWGVVNSAAAYESGMGLGANGYGDASLVGLNLAGALGVEIVLTFLFVFVVLAATREGAPTQVAGVAIGLALGLVHLLGVGLTGTSVNPARSLGPALFVGGDALAQLWVFIVAPLIGGAIAALVCGYLFPADRRLEPEAASTP